MADFIDEAGWIQKTNHKGWYKKMVLQGLS